MNLIPLLSLLKNSYSGIAKVLTPVLLICLCILSWKYHNATVSIDTLTKVNKDLGTQIGTLQNQAQLDSAALQQLQESIRALKAERDEQQAASDYYRSQVNSKAADNFKKVDKKWDSKVLSGRCEEGVSVLRNNALEMTKKFSTVEGTSNVSIETYHVVNPSSTTDGMQPEKSKSSGVDSIQKH